MKIHILPKVITKTDFTLTQVKREGNVAIYEKVFKNTNYVTSYEVIKIRVRPLNELLKKSAKYKDYTHYEVYPSTNEFGSYGYDCGGKNKMEQALQHFNSIIDGEE